MCFDQELSFYPLSGRSATLLPVTRNRITEQACILVFHGRVPLEVLHLAVLHVIERFCRLACSMDQRKQNTQVAKL